MTEQENGSGRSSALARFGARCNGFVVELSYDCSEFDPACEGASHCWPFATVRVPWQHMDRSQARATRAVLAGAGLIPTHRLCRKGHCPFLSEFDQRVLMEPERAKCWLMLLERLYFRLGPCREADRRVYAVRRGMRGAMRMCGAARVCARACMQRGRTHLRPTTISAACFTYYQKKKDRVRKKERKKEKRFIL